MRYLDDTGLDTTIDLFQKINERESVYETNVDQ